MSIITWILANYQTVIVDINALLASLIAICLLIPGDQPEKALQGVVDFLSKLSR